MSYPIDRLPDGTPHPPRLAHPLPGQSMGLGLAEAPFLPGCGLPQAWAGQAQWRMLDTAFGWGKKFLATWAAWRQDPDRPGLLHYVACAARPVTPADLLRAAESHPNLHDLARQLHAQSWGLLAGVHRLAFEQGQVLLTLYLGDAQALLRQQAPQVDSVYLDGFGPERGFEPGDLHTLKAVARCCHRGSRLAAGTLAPPVLDALTQCGFVLHPAPGLPLQGAPLQARFEPAWEPKGTRQACHAPLADGPGDCIVVGGGLAGAAAAASLARRGWRVRVLDRADHPAAGASGLPAGVFAPHVSPDDSLLSRLSRSGIRLTRAMASALLQAGEDWAASGVLEQCLDGKRRLPEAWSHPPGQDWSQPAPTGPLAAAGLPPETIANWHPEGGWIRPARLVAALLAHPRITWQGQACVESLEHTDGLWRLRSPDGALLGEAPVVVLATGAGSIELCAPFWPQRPLRPLRGQVTMGPSHGVEALPPFPVNGHGNLVPRVPSPEGAFWVMGSTFERGESALPLTPAQEAAGHAVNAEKLQALLPPLAKALGPALAPRPGLRAWAAVRCTVPDRVPVVGPIDPEALPGLWVSTAMGARGLTLSLLCGELLAARLHGEPLPLESKLAQALASERLRAP